MNHILKYFLVTLLIPVSINAQLFQKDYLTGNDSLIEEKTLNLHILGTTFFNNNEFFNPYYQGYTLTGSFFQPKIVYTVNPKLILSAGVHLRKYFGDNGFIYAEPLFNIHYRVNNSLNIQMGSFEGGQNHLLPETIFDFENHFSNLVENGILITFNKKFLNSRLWIDWEKFIEPADTFREEFMAGIVNRVKLLNNNSKFHIDIPLFILAHHAGGQINDNNEPVETIFNLCGGLEIFGARAISPFAQIFLHQSSGDYSIGTGYAIQINGGFKTDNIELNAGYFSGWDFMSFRGLPLYHSYSENSLTGYTLGGTNEIWNFKAGYKARLSNTSFLFLRFEGFYNPVVKKLDYIYGLHLQVNEIVRIAQ